MFFYVFIDPEIITEANSHGEMGLGRLVEFLQSLDKDCLVTETEYWRVGEALKEKIKAIDLQHERKEVEELIIHIWKHGPLVVLEDDDFETELLDLAIQHGERDGIDFILTPSENASRPDAGWEACNLTKLHTSEFSRTRKNMEKGKAFREGESTLSALFEDCFRKMIYHADRITIVDYALGEYLGSSQYDNLPKWIRWIDANLRLPSETFLVIKTVGAEGTPSLRALETLLRDLSNEVDIKIQLEPVEKKQLMPHNRYLVAGSKCLDIDRGIDICDENDQCRGVAIKYAGRPN